MIKVLFVCHGNICRSTMAEFVFYNEIKKRGLTDKLSVSSAATHTDEIGNPPHYGTIRKLKQVGVPIIPHRARLLTRNDGNHYDYVIGMDSENLYHMRRILGAEFYNKISLLLDYTATPRAIADPWYSGNFDDTYDDVVMGIQGFLSYLEGSHLI